MKNIQYVFLIFAVFFASCKNQDWEFPDFDYQTVYFAHQYPVRTITLGDDIYDTSLDNEWKFQIMATTGGVYESGTVGIDIEVDNSLVNGLEFGNGNDIIAMPNEYYTLSSNQIVIPKGKLVGGVEVQLTQAFFNDPLAIHNNYVIPVVMTGVNNADSILSGVPVVDNPDRLDPGHWAVMPKDYVLYAVKYINTWHGFYLRRGVDVITGKNGKDELSGTFVRHKQYVEDDEVNKLNTIALNQVEFPLVYKDVDGTNINCPIILTFDDEGNCTVSSASNDYTATGSGKFVVKGEKKSWGNQDRDALYLTYEIDHNELHVAATDTLVMRNRGVTMELFSPVKQ
jgi:hypothetical protein